MCVMGCPSVRARACVCVCVGSKLVSIVITNNSSTLFFEAESLSQTPSSLIWLVSLPSLLWGSPVFAFRNLNYRWVTTPILHLFGV